MPMYLGEVIALKLPCQGGSLSRRSVRSDVEFGKRLRVAMAEAGVSATDLAKNQGVRVQTVSRWRRGELPDDLRLPALADLLRVSLNWLKTGQGTPTDRVRENGAAYRVDPASGARAGDSAESDVTRHADFPAPALWACYERVMLAYYRRTVFEGHSLDGEQVLGWLGDLYKAGLRDVLAAKGLNEELIEDAASRELASDVEAGEQAEAQGEDDRHRKPGA